MGAGRFAADVARLRVEKAQAIDKRLRPFVEQNAKRRPCEICGNLVLPEKLDVHIRAFHS